MPAILIPIGTALGVGGAGTAAAVAGGVAVAAAGTAIGTSVYSASAQKTAAKKAAGHQAYLQGQELEKAEALENEANLSAEKTATRDAAKLKQQRSAAAATGRRNTILTTPLGVAGDAATGQRKTLLGT